MLDNTARVGYCYIFKLQTLSAMIDKDKRLNVFKESLIFTEKMATALERLRLEALKASRENRKDKKRHENEVDINKR